MPADTLIPTMRLRPWVAVLSFVMVAKTLSAADERAPAVPVVRSAASYVQPIDLAALATRYQALPVRDRELIRLFLEGAQRYVLAREDGAFPDAGGEHWRNIAERAHGAAVLSLVPNDWPADLNHRCQQQSIEFINEFVAQYRKEPLFLPPGTNNRGWQASWWAGEMGTAAWFLWDQLSPAVQYDVADMVVFHADRIAAEKPGARVNLDTESETVAWNTCILSLAVNMLHNHPHNPQWQEAAKRYAYTIFATPRDTTDDTPGDDGKPIKDWVGGANIHDDFTLENHNRFHIDYVMTCYRFFIHGEAMYRLGGIPVPKAFHHHTRDVWEQVLLPCSDAAKFAVFVSDNDWKRYHLWTESPAADGFVALTESSPLASALEKASLLNAVDYWRRKFPKDFAFPNPYVCGKAWTPRIADIVLVHLLSSPLPDPLPSSAVETNLVGVHQKRDIGLVTQYSPAGSFRSFYWQPGPVVRHVQPKDDPALVLPISTNFVPLLDGKPAEGAGTKTYTGMGDNWFWVLRREPRGVQEAFVSLPNESVVMLSEISVAALKGVKRIDSVVTVEKPYDKIVATFAGGQASYRYGDAKWDRSDRETGLELKTNWINLNDRIGYVALNLSHDASSMILPKPGERGALGLHHLANLGHDLALITVALPNQAHEKTAAAAAKVSGSRGGDWMGCQLSPFFVWANFGDQEVAIRSPSAPMGPTTAKAPPHSVVILQEDRGWAPLK
jgi:hypothetical protein